MAARIARLAMPFKSYRAGIYPRIAVTPSIHAQHYPQRPDLPQTPTRSLNHLHQRPSYEQSRGYRNKRPTRNPQNNDSDPGADMVSDFLYQVKFIACLGSSIYAITWFIDYFEILPRKSGGERGRGGRRGRREGSGEPDACEDKDGAQEGAGEVWLT
ncbi:hypothetical protein B9Z65_7235 [Elsinoe australis]|uniref:Uncharacterized protein n=1 Tax=Elsinoe australis TaxID=40998 RepID=A0A2P7Z6A0_9PEZI|nr:hypothetical protein B9Z65_7235 [Elsinoe australis]